jgi:protease I
MLPRVDAAEVCRAGGPMSKLAGKKVAFLIADGAEIREVRELQQSLEAEGAQVELVAPKAGEIKAVNGLEAGGTLQATRAVEEVSVPDYDALVLVGGANAVDTLRTDRKAVDLVREFVRCDEPTDKPVAALGLGARLLVEAGVAAGHAFATAPSLQTDIRNAGGAWVDEPAHISGCFVSGRGTDDLEDFRKQMLDAFASGQARGTLPKDEVKTDEDTLDEAVEETFPASDPVPTPTRA